MDPVSAIGLAASSLGLLTALGKALIAAKRTVNEIRELDERTQGLASDLDTFHFALSVFESEMRTGAMMPQIESWWQPAGLDALIKNATRTLSRLRSIYRDIKRRRSTFSRSRQQYRLVSYDPEINRLRLRINTFISAFNVPVVILAMHRSQNQIMDEEQNIDISLLNDRIAQLETSIRAMRDDVLGAVANPNQSHPDPVSTEDSVLRDNEELTEIIRTLISNASSVAASETATSIAPTTVPLTHHMPRRRNDASQRISSLSAAGVSINVDKRSRIEQWISQPEPDQVSQAGETAPHMASLSISEQSGSTSTIYTPAPSTTEGWTENDIDAEIAKRRLEMAKVLLDQKKFAEAIPHLQRSLDSAGPRSSAENSPEALDRFQQIQMLLAKAHIETGSGLDDAKKLLLDQVEVPSTSPPQRSTALYVLSQVYTRLDPPDLGQAAEACLRAVKGRLVMLGKQHQDTQDAIALLCSIYRISGDSDAEIWQSLMAPNIQKNSGTLSRRPTAIFTVRFRRTTYNWWPTLDHVTFSRNGTKIAYCIQEPSGRSSIIFYDLNVFKPREVHDGDHGPDYEKHLVVLRLGRGVTSSQASAKMAYLQRDSMFIMLLDIATNREEAVTTFAGNSERDMPALFFSGDGQTLFFCTDDAQGSERERRYQTHVLWTADGSLCSPQTIEKFWCTEISSAGRVLIGNDYEVPHSPKTTYIKCRSPSEVMNPSLTRRFAWYATNSAISTDESILALHPVEDKNIEFHRVDSGGPSPAIIPTQKCSSTAVVFSPTNPMVAAVVLGFFSPPRFSVSLWDQSAPRQVWEKSLDAPVQETSCTCTFSPDGRLLAVARRNSNSYTGPHEHWISGFDNDFKDSPKLLTYFLDVSDGHIMWSAPLWNVQPALDHRDTHVIFSPDSTMVAARIPGRKFGLLDAWTGKLLWETETEKNELKGGFSPDGRLMAWFLGDALTVWKLR